MHAGFKADRWQLALAGAMTLAVVLAPATDAAAGRIFKYRDENGQTHFVDDYRKVPSKYRDQVDIRSARPTGASEPASAGEAEEGSGEAAGSSEIGAKEGVDLTGLPPDIDPATVVGRDPKTGKFLLDPTRPERLKEEREKAEELEKQQKLGNVDKDGHDRAWWRKRIADCRTEAQYHRDFYKQENAKYVGSQKFGIAAEADRIKKLEEKAKSKEAECARIPEEARAAGAPAGWVR